MARRVLNEPETGGQGPILNMGMQRLSRTTNGSSSDTWETNAGRRCYLKRDKADSKVFYHGAWSGNNVSSYQSGMGCRFYNSGGTAIATDFGWGYIWQNHGGSDMGSALHLFKSFGSFGSLGANETGTCEIRIGWSSRDGSANRPAQQWCGHNNEDNRAMGVHHGFWNAYEVDNSKVSYNIGSSSGGL